MATKWNDGNTSSASAADPIGGRAAIPLVLSGIDAVRSMQPRLKELADASGQAGAADHVDYFLTQPYTGSKRPCLLLFHGAGSEGDRPLVGAVLLYQYRLWGVPLAAYVTEDAGGERNVLGAAGDRSAIALQAARFLLDMGAHLVLLSLKDAGFSPAPGIGRPPERWGLRDRTLLRRLPLLGGYQETLDTLGAHTRRNFRLFRRRGMASYGCSFVPQVSIGENDFLALNALCDYPVPEAVARWRYRSRGEVPGGVLAGVRAAGGRWISMAGGRRYGDTFALDWQMNRTDLARASPATLMRGYLIEHEAAAGTRSLLFQGGTPHSMQSAFEPEHVTDLVASSGRWPARLLGKLAALASGRDNILLRALADPGLHWHSGVTA